MQGRARWQGHGSSQRPPLRTWELLALVSTVLVVSRAVLFLTSAAAPVAAGTWVSGEVCGIPLCTLNPDSSRYANLIEYFVTIGPLSDQPIAILNAGTDYEGSVLGASKNGVSFSFIASLIVLLFDVTPQTASGLLSLAAAVALALTLHSWFRTAGLGNTWLVACLLTPIFTYYGNQATKETWTVFLLIGLVSILHRNILGEVRYRHTSLVVAGVLSVLLYFDREYFLFLAVILGALFVFRSNILPRRVRGAATVASGLGIVAMVIDRAQHTIAPLSSYYEEYGPEGLEFGALDRLIVAVPQTLLAPAGGAGDSAQYLLLVSSLPIFFSYIACFTLISRGWAFKCPGVGFRDPLLWAFVAMIFVWSLTYGGGFERGRDAVVPLLFIAVARWHDAAQGSYAMAALPDARGSRAGPLQGRVSAGQQKFDGVVGGSGMTMDPGRC